MVQRSLLEGYWELSRGLFIAQVGFGGIPGQHRFLGKLADGASRGDQHGHVLSSQSSAGVTLAPGAYCFDAAATLTGALTLDGPATGIWTFKIGTIGTGALTGTSLFPDNSLRLVPRKKASSPMSSSWWGWMIFMLSSRECSEPFGAACFSVLL